MAIFLVWVLCFLIGSIYLGGFIAIALFIWKA